MKNLTKIGGVTAVVAALALTACGGGGGAATGPEAGKGQDAGSDLAKLVSINAKDAKDLQPGGTVTLPLGNIGPDFNGFSNNGNSADNTALHRPIDQAGTWGCWNFDFDGTATPNKDFCEDVKSEVKDGKQTITIKVNEKATYNDGTPIDVKAFENTWNMLKGENKDIDIVSSGAYEFVDSVKAGSSDKEVVVTTTQPVYPLDSLFTGLIHPAVNTPAIFNEGFTGDMHPEWMAGPFKLDQYDSAAKTVTLAQNDKWWGNKPVLEKVVFRQLESSAAIAAFKNGEIDWRFRQHHHPVQAARRHQGLRDPPRPAPLRRRPEPQRAEGAADRRRDPQGDLHRRRPRSAAQGPLQRPELGRNQLRIDDAAAVLQVLPGQLPGQGNRRRGRQEGPHRRRLHGQRRRHHGEGRRPRRLQDQQLR